MSDLGPEIYKLDHRNSSTYFFYGLGVMIALMGVYLAGIGHLKDGAIAVGIGVVFIVGMHLLVRNRPRSLAIHTRGIVVGRADGLDFVTIDRILEVTSEQVQSGAARLMRYKITIAGADPVFLMPASEGGRAVNEAISSLSRALAHAREQKPSRP